MVKSKTDAIHGAEEGIHLARPAGLAIAALVVGIIAALTAWLPFVGFVAGVVAVILGIVALRRKQHKGMAISGIATGGVGIIGSAIAAVFWTVALIVGIGAIGAGSETLQQVNDQLEAQSQKDRAIIEAQKDFSKGSTAVLDDYTVKVNGVDENYQAPEGSPSAAEGKKYISVNVTLTNTTNAPIVVNPYLFSVQSGDQTTLVATVKGATPLRTGELGRNASETGDMVYEIPTDATNLKLVYVTSAYDKGEYRLLTYTLEF